MLANDDNAFASFAIDGLGSNNDADLTSSLIEVAADRHKRNMTMSDAIFKHSSFSNSSGSSMANRISLRLKNAVAVG